MNTHPQRNTLIRPAIVLLAVFALLAGCAPAPAAVPTPAAVSPTAAPLSATATVQPTSAPLATIAPPTATAEPATATAEPATATAEPTPEPTDAAQTGSADAGGALAVEDKDGLPVPADYTGYSGEQSPFRRGLTATSPSPLPAVLALYRAELPARQWAELPGTVAPTDDEATLAFTSPEQGQLALKLTRNADGGTEIALTIRDEAAAKAAGALPPAGKARIYFANPNEAEVSFNIAGQDVAVAVGKPGDTMADATRIDVAPGEYPFTLTQAGADPATDQIRVAEGEIWILVAGPGGALAIQAY